MSSHAHLKTALLGMVLLGQASLAAAEEPGHSSRPVESAPPVPGGDPIQNSITINDDDPESSIPSFEAAMKNPLQMGYFLMALSERADRASQRGDHAKEAKYYRAMTKAVPERAIGYRRACAAHDLAGEHVKAIEMCRAALGASGITVQDHLQFLTVLLKKPQPLKPSEIEDADAVVARLGGELKLNQDEAGRKIVAEAKCQIGAKLEDVARLTACAEHVRELRLEPAKVLTYEWALAIAQGDPNGAQRVVDKAKQVGLPAAALQAMQRGVAKASGSPNHSSFMFKQWWPILVGFLAIFALYFVKTRRSRLTPI